MLRCYRGFMEKRKRKQAKGKSAVLGNEEKQEQETCTPFPSYSGCGCPTCVSSSSAGTRSLKKKMTGMPISGLPVNPEAVLMASPANIRYPKILAIVPVTILDGRLMLRKNGCSNPELNINNLFVNPGKKCVYAGQVWDAFGVLQPKLYDQKRRNSCKN